MSGKSKPTTVDVTRAMLDPESVFASPEQVVEHGGLSADQKIEILRRWANQAAEVAAAEDEGMPGGNDDLLRRVLLALDRLSGGIDVEHTAPTRQDGLPRSSVKPK